MVASAFIADRVTDSNLALRAMPAGAESALLRATLAKSEARIAWMQEIGSALGRFTRRQDLLELVVDRITRLMDAERTRLFLVSEDGRELWSTVAQGGGEHEIRFRMGEGLAGWAARRAQRINIKDAHADPRFDPSLDGGDGFVTSSVLVQPLRNTDGEVIGVLEVLNKRFGYFTAADEALLESLANTATYAIEYHRLYRELFDHNVALLATKQELEERVSQMAALTQVHRALSAAHDIAEACEVVASSVLGLMPSEVCAITLNESGRYRTHAYQAGPVPNSVTRSRRSWPTRTVRVEGDPREPGSHSVLASPLIVEGQTLGVIELVGRNRTRRWVDEPSFSDDDVRLLDLFSAQVSSTLDAAILRERRHREDRLAAIGQMLSGIVHDLNSPLSVAKGYVQLLAREASDDRRGRFASKVLQQLDDISSMTREVLAYARGDTTLLLRRVHVHMLADEVREALEHELASLGIGLTVETSWRGELWLDDGKLKRVLFNLARNAREAMPQGGTYRVTFVREAEELVIECSDSGPGIDAALGEHVFEPFVSTKRGGNSGLGLAIVRKLVHDHTGTVSYRSAAGEGTTFTIRIPVRESPPEGHR
jgi:signal transduction histidine kinase